MLFSFSDKKLVAFDIGSSSVKLAEVDQTSRGPILRKFAVAPITPGMVQNGEISEIPGVSHVIQNLVALTKTKRKNAISGLWGNGVIVKKITIPKIEVKLVAEQLKWEAEQYIPFDINEVSLEYHILNRPSAETMDVLLVAAKQDYVFRVIEALESAQLKCALVDVVSFALANCFEANYGVRERPVALLNIGAGVTNFVVVEKGETIFSRDIAVGGQTYTTEISKAMNVNFNEAESLKISASLGQEVPDEVNTIIKHTNEQILDEMRNSFEFYMATGGGAPVSHIYISGGSVFLPGLVEEISKATGIPFEPFDPFLKIQYDAKAFTANYIDQIKAISPVVLGLALRRIDER